MGNFCLLKNNGAPPLKKADSLGREGVRGKAPPSPEGFPSPVQAFPRSLAMRNPVPRIAAIHDMSGFGRTSLTVAIPILSCMGIQVCPMPTAVLSTHTVEFTDYTLCDLTPELGGILDHWEASSRAASFRATACPSRWIAPSSSSPSASGPHSGKGCLRAKASCWNASSAACSRPSRPANAGSWTGTAAIPRRPPLKADMGPASRPKGARSKSRTAGRPGRERPIRYGGMGQRIC